MFCMTGAAQRRITPTEAANIRFQRPIHRTIRNDASATRPQILPSKTLNFTVLVRMTGSRRGPWWLMTSLSITFNVKRHTLQIAFAEKNSKGNLRGQLERKCLELERRYNDILIIGPCQQDYNRSNLNPNKTKRIPRTGSTIP